MAKIQVFRQQKDVLPKIKEGDYIAESFRNRDVRESTRGRNGSLGECDPRNAYIELVYLLRRYDGEIDCPQTYHQFCFDLNQYFLKVWGTRYTLFDAENVGTTCERKEYCSVEYWPFGYLGNDNNFIINKGAPFYEIKRVMEILMDFQKWCANIPEYEAEMLEMKAHEFANCFGNIEDTYKRFVKNHWKKDPLRKKNTFNGPGKDAGKSIKERMEEMTNKIFGKKRQK